MANIHPVDSHICLSCQIPFLRLWVFNLTSFPFLCSTGTTTYEYHMKACFQMEQNIKLQDSRKTHNASVPVYPNWHFRFETSVLPRPLVRFLLNKHGRLGAV